MSKRLLGEERIKMRNIEEENELMKKEERSEI